MLEHTFRHMAGIGAKTEADLWSAGLTSWYAVRDADELPLSPRKAERLREQVEESIAQFEEGNVRFFQDGLPASEQWRLFRDFRHSVAYVDIETTGLSSAGDYITTIALYDGKSIRSYVQHQNLFDFLEDIQAYDLLVTYNGKTFDVPFLRAYMGAALEQAHVDLRYVLASLGFRGGLKKCEIQFGLSRDDLEEVDGFFAVLLWFDYFKGGNKRALETLQAYNVLDVVNLERLMVEAYNRRAGETPFGESLQLPIPDMPEIPFAADRATIRRLKSRSYW